MRIYEKDIQPMKIISRLFILCFVVLWVCGHTLSGYAQAPVEITSDSSLTITALEAGIESFIRKPLLWVIYQNEDNDSIQNKLQIRRFKVLTSDEAFKREAVTKILCQFDAAMPPGTCEIWLKPAGGQQHLDSIRIHSDVVVKNPEITEVFPYLDTEKKDIYMLKGRFFGMKPRISIVFDLENGDTGLIPCHYAGPLPYPDALGNPARSCMDLFSGNSEIRVTPVKALPASGDLWLELQSKTGKTRFQLNPGAKSDVTLKMHVESGSLGSTSPGPGEYRVPVGLPFEISAAPIHNGEQKGYFNGWRLEGDGSILEIPDGSAFVTLQANCTLTATFSLQPETTLQVEPPESGTIESELLSGVPMTMDKAFELSARPAKGFHFSHWETNASVRVNDSFRSDTNVYLTKPRNAAITAYFIPDMDEVSFDGLQTVAACIASDEESGETVSKAWLSWRPASCVGTPMDRMTYHIYMGPSKERNDLLRPENLVKTVVGSSFAIIDIPDETGIRYFLVAAEALNGAESPTLPPVPAKQGRLTLRRTPKVLTNIVSTPVDYSYSTMTFEGDYSDQFKVDDFLVYPHMDTGQLRLGKIKVVYSDGSRTILAVNEAAFDQIIREGQLNITVSWRCLNALPVEKYPFYSTLYPGVDFKYGIRFLPDLMIDVTYDPEGLQQLNAQLSGPLDIKGVLELALDQPGEHFGNHLLPLTTRYNAFDLLSGMLPLQQTNHFTLNGGIDFKIEKPLNMKTHINLETVLLSKTTWSRDNGWTFSGKSTSPVHELTCDLDRINDATCVLHLIPEFSASMFTKEFLRTNSHIRFSVKMKSEKEPVDAFDLFDVYHYHSTRARFWFRPFRDNSGNSGLLYQEPNIFSDLIFSLPQVRSLLSGETVVSQEYRLSPCISNGVNNLLCNDMQCDFFWSMEPPEYQDDMTVYPAYYSESKSCWIQDVVFIPRRLRNYTITVKVKGDGFLGDLGTQVKSSVIKAVLPRNP